MSPFRRNLLYLYSKAVYEIRPVAIAKEREVSTDTELTSTNSTQLKTARGQQQPRNIFEFYLSTLHLHAKLRISSLVKYIPSNGLREVFQHHGRLPQGSDWLVVYADLIESIDLHGGSPQKSRRRTTRKLIATTPSPRFHMNLRIFKILLPLLYRPKRRIWSFTPVVGDYL